jgi:hypothetical protein
MSKNRIERPYAMLSEPTFQVAGAELPRLITVPAIPTEVIIPGIKIRAYPTLQVTVKRTSRLVPATAKAGKGPMD